MSESVNFQSACSQSVISSSRNNNGVLCHCKCEAPIVRAWTRENPGRRFYGCRGFGVGNGHESCNFFRWYDVEKPHGWQYLALQEAREIMQEQKEEIANLRAKVRSLTHECSNEFSRELEDEMKEKGEECEALKREVLILSERSSMLRNALVASYVGFGVVVGGIMVMSRW
ncbi:BnaC02g17170D [Brassica napus]|uniref:BnaC02g17170D protein n=1 Tax=Brassica napus TaxID=3708 RepID=A0A078HV02_BRANA|nr:uncharacterized protein LOC106369736 [Brassica napus]CDY42340.1 BnaC02g17170D [Brassica napus]